MKTNDLDFRVTDSSTEGEVLTLEDFLPDIEQPTDTLDIDLDVDVDEAEEADELDNVIDPQPTDNDDGLKIDAPEAKEEDDDVKVPTGTNYKEVLKGLIDKKLVSAFDEIEMEDGTTITFDELDVDEETFASILSTAIDEIKDKAKEGKVSTEGISDFTKQLIEVEKAGGNVANAIATYQKYKEPLTSLDLDNESDQEVAIYLRYNAQGLSDAEISKITKGFKAQGILEEEAHKAKEVIDTAFNEHMKTMKEEAEQAEIKRKENIVNYRNTLSTSLDKLSVGKALKKQILDSATKENKEKSFDLDKAYYTLRNDPEKAAELALFILNREEYLSRATKQASRDEAIKTMKTFKLAKRTSGNLNLSTQEDKGRKGDIDLDQIFS